MSTWTAPITWVNGAVTAATANVEWRDHLNFIKGSLDLLTNSTTADTGTTMYVQVRRTNSTDPVFEGQVGAEANPRIRITADGKIAFGAGGASAPDITFARNSSTSFRADGAVIQVQRPSVGTQFLSGIVSGDAVNRVQLDSIGTGNGGRLAVGDGTTLPLGSFYYDVTNTSVILNAASTSIRAIVPGGAGFFASGSASGVSYLGLTPDNGAGHSLLFNYAGGSSKLTVTSGTPNRIGSDGRFAAGDGLVTKTKAGTISDGDFGPSAAESGMFGVDTTNQRWYVRVGSTWKFADLAGDLVTFGPWTYTNLAASQTNLEATIADISRIVQPYPGDIVAITARGNAAITAGGASAAVFKCAINGTAGTLSTTLDSTTNTGFNTATQSVGIDTFSSGQGLSVLVTTSGTFAPTTTEYDIWLYTLLRRP